MINLIHCKKRQLQEEINKNKVICVGAGKRLKDFFSFWVTEENVHNIIGVLDFYKSNCEIKFLNRTIPVYNVQTFLNNTHEDNYVLIITNIHSCMEIVESLDKYDVFDGKKCYIEYIIDEEYPNQTFLELDSDEVLIPPKIHYCWFGNNPIPLHLQSCIDSWKKYCPEYEIVRWDESNYDITQNMYMETAYKEKKWGFVPDYARLDIIYKHGGI